VTLSHPTTGEPLEPIITSGQAAEILGRNRDTIEKECREGIIATRPRLNDGGPWQIITAKLLRELGLMESA
jgi:hypothetical protein